PADAVVTRLQEAVHYRLPNRRCHLSAYVLTLPAALLGGVVFELLLGLPFFVPILIAAYLTWRFTWHYELTLTAKHLSVDCMTSGTRRNVRVIALSQIEQFTLIQLPRRTLLQAESSNDLTELILADRELDGLSRLANELAARHAGFGEKGKPIRVAM